MQKMKIGISFFGILTLGSLLLTRSYLALAALLAAAMHESGHLLAARMRSIKIKELRIDVFGALISTRGELSSYLDELILAAGGPAVNLITALLLFLTGAVALPFGRLLLISSLFLGLLNLMPVRELDGGRMLRCVLCQRLPLRLCEGICDTLSFCFISVLWLLSVYLLLTRSASLSLFVFSAFLFCRIFLRQKN